MAFLGYDINALHRLRWATLGAGRELDIIRMGDERAADAQRCVRVAVTALEYWDRRIDALLASRCMSGTRLAFVDGNDLRHAVFETQRRTLGWAVTLDPFGAASTLDSAGSSVLDIPRLSAEDLTVVLRAVGERMATVDIDRLLDTEAERRWLTELLERASHNPTLSAVWLGSLTADGLSELCDGLARSRWEARSYDDAASPDIDAMLIAVAGVLNAAPNVVPPSDLLASMDLYAAALLLRELDLEADTLGRLAADLIDRYGRYESDLCNPLSWGELLGDLIVPKILATAGASTRVLLDADPLAVNQLALPDHGLVQALYLDGTSPANASAKDAVKILVSLLTLLPTTQTERFDLLADATWLGELLGPYVFHFLMDADEWSMKVADLAPLLGFVIDQDSALTALLSRLGSLAKQATDGLVGSLDSDQARRLLGKVVELIAFVRTWILMSDLRTAEANAAALDLVFLSVDLAMMAFGPELRLIEEIGYQFLTSASGDLLGGGDVSERITETAAKWGLDDRGVAYAALRTIARSLKVAEPPAPPTTVQPCDSAAYRQALFVWLDATFTGINARHSASVEHLIDIVLSASAVGTQCGTTGN